MHCKKKDDQDQFFECDQTEFLADASEWEKIYLS